MLTRIKKFLPKTLVTVLITIYRKVKKFRKKTKHKINMLKATREIKNHSIKWKDKNRFEIYRYLQKRNGYIFNDEAEAVREQYFSRQISIHADTEYDLLYVELDDKRMYLKKTMNLSSVSNYINSLSFEQDSNNPHRYFTNDKDFFGVIKSTRIREEKYSFGVESGDVVIDIGSCEGNFALSVVDVAKKVYIFEKDERWNEPLRATFSPYGNKVEIYNKYISNESNKTSITIDDFIKQTSVNVNFIKADIEGYERQFLLGAEETLRKASNMKIALCTYHKANDANELASLLESYGFKIYFTEGWLVFPRGNPPYLRKVVIRAVK